MDNFSYIGLSRQIALRNLMEVTANNIANMSTPGFKSQNVLFREHLNKGTASTKFSQVEQVRTYRDMAAGTLMQTHNPLDVSIQGDGYFAVQTKDGGTKYTRAGSFSLNERGELITKNGDQILGDGGPLIVPAGSGEINISAAGTISTKTGTIGKLKVVSFEDSSKIEPFGDNLFSAPEGQEQPAADVQIVQGALENSNVQPVLEMNKMIEILRMYQSMQNMLNTDHELSRSMIQKLTKA